MSQTDAHERITKWRGPAGEPADDTVAREEPLEIRLNGSPLVVLMRTPGHDLDLAAGWLLTEGVVGAIDDIVSMRHCTVVPDPEAEDNILLVNLRPEVTPDWQRLKRNIYANSACGLCGKATIEAALQTAPPIEDAVSVSPEVLYALPDRLRAAQATFAHTGGLHAAGLFTPTGELLAAREDVGRHNAVDKAVGWALRSRTPLAGHALMVSGRTSYEIVQKAAAARVPVVAAVSAPSSLAVSLARAAGITLVGFLRGRSMNVYTHGERIA